MPDKPIYFIPGRGESLDEGIGQVIASMGFSVKGREMISDFARLGFSEQLALIRSDLESDFWRPESVLIGRSYGAYLLLHTLAELEPFPGKVLLFSPVLGAAISEDRRSGVLPPRSKLLLKLADSGGFPAPCSLEIHTGAKDNGCDPALAIRFASLVGNTKLYIVPGSGHEFDEDYVRSVLDRFLCEPSPQQIEFDGVLID